ncbi:TPA: DUF1471 domain-containing protein [Vibrio vulnificus]|uniref:DUF1471 domain-containing protein n=1 Tax=Vibrio vulnificus TaxID=672 RepID=A0A2S3R564_VIBVL|nr:DUF1471 domain-containing protein [Vibrio vulnificus]EGQ7700617.1 DUF1471 domain-containing protein [Vibrio vulnificus]EGQ7956457.1 DUF1471 domain-containing protein [Vibrio vulnificus]EGQ7986747.1 DUF1471 domain-containing protein [Vibrio vulnificus]EGQ8175154.1 DUF1471 domain-containing protein [Vibrio vulnificus]EGQ9238870.1 DUF1471 domain-containing protein [Vibrio vulnificus]
MKKTVLLLALATVLSGCVTRKIPVMAEARNVTPITDVAVSNLKCDFVKVFTLEDSHPNNVIASLKNETYLAGGNRYKIAEVLATRRGRPSSVVAEMYSCNNMSKTSLESQISLIPGAQNVMPIAFSEVENNSCKILTTHVFNEVSLKDLETELANKTYMLGGNRFHITKIIESESGEPNSVVADIYRCKHRTVNF